MLMGAQFRLQLELSTNYYSRQYPARAREIQMHAGARAYTYHACRSRG